MQTFLPYASFIETAQCLDNLRLVNQCCNESVRLYQGKWPNHPAAKMWANHKYALARYNHALAAEWYARRVAKGGHGVAEAALRWKLFWHQQIDTLLAEGADTSMPPWLGDKRVHTTHRACLLAKLPDHYGQCGWDEQPSPPDDKCKWPYFWPV